jgi:hypothetical protein
MWRSSSVSRFPLYDSIGSGRALVDASGAITDTYHMDAFGRPVASTGLALPPRFSAESRGAGTTLRMCSAACARQ